jgi:multisubunit Na+/H+ antiporter MnhE subunit
MEAIIDILPATTPRVIRVWWAYFWRYLTTLIAMTIGMAMVGVIIGVLVRLLMHMLGLDAEHAQRLAGLAGLVLGFAAVLASSAIPLWLILGKDFGEFRLALISYRPVAAPPAPDQDG